MCNKAPAPCVCSIFLFCVLSLGVDEELVDIIYENFIEFAR